MNHFSRFFLLFTVIILEGYIVLSTELLAIRQTLPFIGSGTDTVSIIIAAVLMPLAFGYQAGGQFKPKIHKGRYFGFRQKLLQNLLISQGILLVGLSYICLAVFFTIPLQNGLSNRLVLATLYALCFLVVPVYLMGQTVPLISNYFSKKKLSDITGKMLFFSTMGSFLGAIFSTLVLMSFAGVHYTAALNFVLLFLLVFLLDKNKRSLRVVLSFILAFSGLLLNSETIMKGFHIIKNNKYNTIALYEENGKRHLLINNVSSSMYSDKHEKYEYVKFIEQVAIQSIPPAASPKDILVIGAGGFTLGHEDHKNRYTFIDLDKDLKAVAEKHILKEKLGDNVTFYPEEARAFLRRDTKLYDIIVLDVYSGYMTIPEHLVTADFFAQIKSHVKEGGLVFANFIVAPNFGSLFSQNLDNTFRSIFPHVSRETVQKDLHLWDETPDALENVIYIYRHDTKVQGDKVYTDNKNSVFYDKPVKLP